MEARGVALSPASAPSELSDRGLGQASPPPCSGCGSLTGWPGGPKLRGQRLVWPMGLWFSSCRHVVGPVRCAACDSHIYIKVLGEAILSSAFLEQFEPDVSSLRARVSVPTLSCFAS